MGKLSVLMFAVMTVASCGKIAKTDPTSSSNPVETPSLKSTPLFVLAPTTPTELQVHLSEVANVTYEVKNNSRLTMTIEMRPILGAIQTLEATGACANPFTLAPAETCLLTLQFIGNLLPAQITGGPVICKSGNTLQCYQPSEANVLKITRIDSE